MNYILNEIFGWIQQDYASNKLRFCLETLAWCISVGCSFVMAITVPNPPLVIMYPFWITGCAIYAGCAFSRRSFGMLANYILLVSIDSVGLIRMLIV
jgi:hypothetical protein